MTATSLLSAHAVTEGNQVEREAKHAAGETMHRNFEVFDFNQPDISPEENLERVFLGITPEAKQTGGNGMTKKQLNEENQQLREELAAATEAWDMTHDLLEEAWDEIAQLRLQLGADHLNAHVESKLNKPEDLK